MGTQTTLESLLVDRYNLDAAGRDANPMRCTNPTCYVALNLGWQRPARDSYQHKRYPCLFGSSIG